MVRKHGRRTETRPGSTAGLNLGKVRATAQGGDIADGEKLEHEQKLRRVMFSIKTETKTAGKRDTQRMEPERLAPQRQMADFPRAEGYSGCRRPSRVSRVPGLVYP